GPSAPSAVSSPGPRPTPKRSTPSGRPSCSGGPMGCGRWRRNWTLWCRNAREPTSLGGCPMPAGRPSLLTPEVLEEVRRLLPTVLYLETVADYLGLSRQTWRGWLRRGRKEHARLAKNPRARPKASE